MIIQIFVKKALRFGLHCIRKPFITLWTYKYFPRIFLFFKFGIAKNVNTQPYWSDVHEKEDKEHKSRFDNGVKSLLSHVDFVGKDVLDIGCGRGMFLKQIPEAKSRTGVDISQSAIKRLEENGMKGYVRTLPSLDMDDIYDIVTCFETLEHTRFWKKSIKNMLPVLRDGGYLLISVPFENGIVISEHVTYFDLERLYGFLRRHVTVLEIKILGPWLLVISQKKRYSRGEVPGYHRELHTQNI